ncbi:hypothetical protein COCNU_03G015600 [Cocos nucifera]|uniref:Uncharacterized protein n=1 Tax=Cocos nucifera TaxID=13894 RepID=A0A8K0MZX7_COCNU|nr:hypothetical protein COCNU_03G015600 [Cocos nucifera]
MMCLVATLIILLAGMLSQIAFLALITAMSIVAGTIGTGRIWKKRRLAPISDYVERLRDLCRRGLIELYATIQRATTPRPAIVYNVHSRGGSQEIGSQQAQEPQAISSGVIYIDYRTRSSKNQEDEPKANIYRRNPARGRQPTKLCSNFKMPKRGLINLRAVRQMVQFVKVLIRILVARLIGIVGERRGRYLERGSEIRFQNLEQWRELYRRGLDWLYTTIIQGGSINQRPGIANNNDRLRRGKSRGNWWRLVLGRCTRSSPVAREGSPEMGLRQLLVQEPQTTRWEEIISRGEWIGPSDTSIHAGMNLERKLREEVRRLEGEMSAKLKLEDKGKKKMEEVKKGIKIIGEKGKEEEEEEEETMEEDREEDGAGRSIDGE